MGEGYLVMSNVAFSPSFMVVTPSSQPIVVFVNDLYQRSSGCDGMHMESTSDDLANANGSNESTTADRGIEPR